MSDKASSYFLGVFLAIFGVYCYAMIDVIYKWLSSGYPIVELLFFRFLFGLIILFAWQGPKGFKKYHSGQYYKEHLIKFLCMVSAVVASIIALKLLPLTDFTVLCFTYVFFTIILAAIFFGEHVGVHRISAVIMGFAGVLFVMQPSAASFGWGGFFALLSAFMYGVTTLVTKKLSDTQHSITITIYYTVLGLVFSGLLLPFFWQTPTLIDLSLLFLVAIFGTVNNIVIIEAMHHIPVYLVSFFDYTTLIWAVLFGYLIWSEIPTYMTLTGALVIVGSGIYIIIREKIRQTKEGYKHET